MNKLFVVVARHLCLSIGHFICPTNYNFLNKNSFLLYDILTVLINSLGPYKNKRNKIIDYQRECLYVYRDSNRVSQKGYLLKGNLNYNKNLVYLQKVQVLTRQAFPAHPQEVYRCRC